MERLVRNVALLADLGAAPREPRCIDCDGYTLCFRSTSEARPLVRDQQISNRFSIRFWGVRGSLATSGPDFSLVGGNTSCVEVRLGHELIILDAGTGLYRLGCNLPRRIEATLLLSHFHWDHIQGFPFFRPAYDSGTELSIYGPGDDARQIEEAMRRQMEAPHFPVPLESMDAKFRYGALRSGAEFQVGGARIEARRLNHRRSVSATASAPAARASLMSPIPSTSTTAASTPT